MVKTWFVAPTLRKLATTFACYTRLDAEHAAAIQDFAKDSGLVIEVLFDRSLIHGAPGLA